MLLEGVDFCKQCGADVIVAVGGGSAIDNKKSNCYHYEKSRIC